jgi:hypothetical protein
VTSTPSSARIKAAYETASSAFDILMICNSDNLISAQASNAQSNIACDSPTNVCCRCRCIWVFVKNFDVDCHKKFHCISENCSVWFGKPATAGDWLTCQKKLAASLP